MMAGLLLISDTLLQDEKLKAEITCCGKWHSINTHCSHEIHRRWCLYMNKIFRSVLVLRYQNQVS